MTTQTFWSQMLRGKTIVRALMNLRLQKELMAQGKILDLGGTKKPVPSYRSFLAVAPESEVLVLNIDADAQPDVVADATKAPFADASFDVVWCFNLLEHVADPIAVLREAQRVLKPDGRLFTFTPFLVRVHGHPEDYARYTDTALRRFAAGSGFDRVSVEGLGFGPFTAGLAQVQAYMSRFIFIPGLVLCQLFDRFLLRLRPTYRGRWPLGFYAVMRKPMTTAPTY